MYRLVLERLKNAGRIPTGQDDFRVFAVLVHRIRRALYRAGYRIDHAVADST